MAVSKTCGRFGRKYLTINDLLLYSAFLGLFVTGIVLLWPWSWWEKQQQIFAVLNHDSAQTKIISGNDEAAPSRDESCSYYSCFDVYKCAMKKNIITAYIYPIYRYVDEKGALISVPHSHEFLEALNAIHKSHYFTSNPDDACIFIPSLDLLNQDTLRLRETSQVLASLPFWSNGSNHLLFNMIPGSAPDFNPVLEVPMDKAILAGSGLTESTYRRGFDISIPMYSPLSRGFVENSALYSPLSRKWLVLSSQTDVHFEYLHELMLLEEHSELLILDRCPGDFLGYNSSMRCKGAEVYFYPEILKNSTFCLMIRGARFGHLVLTEAMMYGCIPVIVADSFILPFSEVIDWKRASILLYEDELPELMNILKSVSDERISEMRKQVYFLWSRYFSSMEKIALTVMKILNDHVSPHTARSSRDWNNNPQQFGTMPPLFLPIIAPKSQGFTAVILTFDRVESLFQVIQRVSQAPSLAKVLVVWNNQKKSPPPASMWPKINKLLKVVQTRENKLSNRFYPYDEIETEAVLAIDDDIIMLTADELEFGYEVWREFPDRIVGFPSRVHMWDNVTNRWKYESEWMNEISMVLTGAAFYHKYYSYLYTTAMPGNIKAWVDKHMNCEDIAMNFLVANVTGKAPIKVTPRKKFKCPECTNVEMLSADITHMVERSDCINRFAKIYGTMPLLTVEFRADPVLFKDNFPEKLKRFNNLGSL